MTTFERLDLLSELENLMRDGLRTDAEDRERRARMAEICRIFNRRYPQDVMDDFDFDTAWNNAVNARSE